MYTVECLGNKVGLIEATDERKVLGTIEFTKINSYADLWKFIDSYIGSSTKCKISQNVEKILF